MLNYNGDPVANAHGQPGIFQTPQAPNLVSNPNPNQHIFGLNELPTSQRNVRIVPRLTEETLIPRQCPFLQSEGKEAVPARAIIANVLWLSPFQTASVIPFPWIDLDCH